MYSVPYFNAFETYCYREFRSPEKALLFFFYISGLKFTALLYANDERVFVTNDGKA